MALRRATGTRADPLPPPPSVRGPEYLQAHACFDCRKSWKVRPDKPATCPQCRGPLHDMGRTFKAPRKTDAEQWQKVRALWENGFRFFSYRSHPHAEPLPERLKEVADFVRRNPDHPARVA
jgi:predicted amidophosphoribosyltransferase